MADSTQPGEQLNADEASRQKARERNRRYHERHAERIRERARRRYREQKASGRLPDREKTRKWGRKTGKQYRERHRDEILARARDWRSSNKDKIRGYNRKYSNKKRREDYLFALKQDVGNRVRYALSSQSARKSTKALLLVGCTVQQLALHIESQFRPGMSWENRGEWHLDHIIPVSKFNLSDPMQQAAAFHYTNMQPLWAQENRKKSDKVPGQNLFGFAYAAKIAGAIDKVPKKRRKHGG